jgi:hypothetical protein
LNLNVRQLQLAATRTIDERRVSVFDAASEMLQASSTPRTCRTDEAALMPVEGGWSHAAVTRLSPVA